MSNFPSDFDDDTTLPFVNDNITEIGGEAINALRDAVFAIEQNIGIGAAGTTGSIAARFGVSFFPDGYLKPSAIASMGLVTLPITQDQIAPWAMIPESKLKLDHRTQDLFNYIRDLSGDVNLAIGWISVTGVKLDPHLIGAIYRHTMDQVDVHPNTANFLSNKFRVLRDNLQSYNLVRDINDELLAHQWADGSPFGFIQDVFTNNNSTYPSNYAHVASGIYLNTSRFTTIPQTTLDVQAFAEFIDSASIFLLGTRIQNLYSNGISRASRSAALDEEAQIEGIGQHLVPVTPATAYLKNIGTSSSPFDDINTGDDIIEFKPSVTDQNNNTFDAKFALIKIGDIIRVNYGTIEVPFIIKEKKYIQDSGNKKYIIRIAGKNIAYTTTATARVDRPLFYNNKYGVLSLSAVNNNFTEIPSLIVASPRGGEALGVGFSPEQFDETHYLLYLALFPTGSPQDGYTILPPIDVTGNLGVTPGLYTLESVVEATNAALRATGYNYRFVAFAYQGEFGIMLADSYSNAAFSILSGVVDDNGFFDQVATELTFTNNVVDVFPSVGAIGIDPLGIGPFGANVASPPYMTVYGSAEASQNPTKLFVPLSKNNFYINGGERDRLTLDVGQALDGYGDGYWHAEIVDKQVFPGPVPSGRVQTTYRIPLDLSTSNLKAGKTLVVQANSGTLVDSGRFIIQSVAFACALTNYTDITVYDAVHAKGFSPTSTLSIGSTVSIYFNSDSVSFNDETATDFSSVTPFKRHFEVYTKQDGATFTHERGRFLASGVSIDVNNGVTLYSSTEVAKMDIIKISPKLRGYQYGSVTKIALHINNYSATTGVFDGFLAAYDGVTFTKQGPNISGKKGEVVRFYDETSIDYIDILFDISSTITTVSDQTVDIQLFPTLSLDDEIMLIGTCQLNDTNNFVNRVRDERQFGNISEKEISTSLYNFMALPERLLHFNGVVRGFDIVNITSEVISLRGGVALVNGKFQSLNNEIFFIPKIKELYNFSLYSVNWLLCVDSLGELNVIAMLDFDSVLGTPNNPTRIFVASNVVSSNTYDIDCTTFSDLLNNRVEFTPLYIISSTVTGTGPSATVSLTTRDVRRFINDQDSCMPTVITNDNSQGNFKNVNTAINWLRFNNLFQNDLSIKGSATVTGAFTFTTGHLNIYPGGAGAALSFNNTVNASNFRFTDIPTSISSGADFVDSVFDNSPLTVGGTGTFNSVNFVKCGNTTFVGNLSATDSNFSQGTLDIGPTATLTNATFTNCPIDIGGGPASTLTDVTLIMSPLTIGASSGTTLLFTTTVTESDITVSGTGGFETAGCSLANSVLNIGGLAYLGVQAIPSVMTGNIGTTLMDCHITASAVTAPLTLFNRTDVVIAAGGGFASNQARFMDCDLDLSGMGSNASMDSSTFENSTVVIGGAATSIGGCRFTNCYVSIGSTSNLLGCTFIDCTVICTGVATVSDTSFRGCDLTFTAGGTFTNVTINPSIVNIGATITLVGKNSIQDSTLTISAVRGFTLADDFTFLRNNVTWTGHESTGYSGTNLVNSGNGLIFAGVSATLSNIKVEDNTFNYALQDHFPFFSLQLNTFAAVVRNVSVSGNKFNSSAGVDDLRAAIAVASTLFSRASLGTYPQFPSLINVHFDRNTCNYNQMIIISGPKDVAIGSMNGANPVVTDTTISGNTCGTIGYFIGSAGPFDGTNVGNPNNGVIRDKSNKLVIANNFCKFIANLDYLGDYIPFRATFYPAGANLYEEVASTVGEAAILNNTCNWIQVGAGGYTVAQSGVSIIGNTVSPSNPNYLNSFASTGFQSITPANVGILLRREHNAIGSSSSIIAENNIVQKYTTTASAGFTITSATNASPIVITTSTPHGFATGQLVNISGVAVNTAANGTWIITTGGGNQFSLNGSVGNGVGTGGLVVSTNIWYYIGGIACFNHCRIQNNVIAGVINSQSPMIYTWDINSQIVTGNILERRGLTVSSYFYMDGLSGPGTAAQKLAITNNTMDAVDPGGVGTLNRYFIAAVTGIGYGTGAAVGAVQTGWRVNSNIAGTQGAGFLYI